MSRLSEDLLLQEALAEDPKGPNSSSNWLLKPKPPRTVVSAVLAAPQSTSCPVPFLQKGRDLQGERVRSCLRSHGEFVSWLCAASALFI